MHELAARVIAQLENLLDRTLLEFIPRRDFLIEQPLRVAQLHRENVEHYPADGRHTAACKWD